jgi:hypothetical protein
MRGFMFEQLPAWHGKITLRGALLNAIGFGFGAGMTLGVIILRTVLLRVPVLFQLGELGYFVVSLALAVRFYFLTMSRARGETDKTVEISCAN